MNPVDHMDHMDHMNHMNHSAMDHSLHTMTPPHHHTTSGHDHGGGGESGGHGGMVRGGAYHCYMIHRHANMAVASWCKLLAC